MPSCPPLRWADLAGARVGIWGLGAEGNASRRRLESMGVAPLLVDEAPGQPSVLDLAAGGLDALHGCEVVIKAPGVSRYRPEVVDLEQDGIAVVGGLGLWLEGADRERVIGVTGTKGKSTTVSIIGHLLEGLGVRGFVGGNLGTPPFDVDTPAGVDVWVIEMSSFQVTDLWSGPAVAGITSLHADHLDWHGSFDRYAADKLSLCTKPGVRAVIANGDDALLRANAAFLGPEPHWLSASVSPWVASLGLRGAHNHMNALIARACLTALGIHEASDDDLVAAAAGGFRGLPSRLQSLGTVDGVEFVDDSLSTNVLPTVAAVSVFPDRPVALLVGGFDRQIDYTPLAVHLSSRQAPLLVLALPDNGDRIREAIESVAQPPTVTVEPSSDLEQAVRRGFEWSRPGGVVLLSPAAPSFGRYANYAARSDAFRLAMEACGS